MPRDPREGVLASAASALLGHEHVRREVHRRQRLEGSLPPPHRRARRRKAVPARERRAEARALRDGHGRRAPRRRSRSRTQGRRAPREPAPRRRRRRRPHSRRAARFHGERVDRDRSEEACILQDRGGAGDAMARRAQAAGPRTDAGARGHSRAKGASEAGRSLIQGRRPRRCQARGGRGEGAR